MAQLNVSQALLDEQRTVTSVFNIDVNVTASILDSYQSASLGMKAPLNNIIGAWSQDPRMAATFAMHVIAFVFGSLSAVAAFHPRLNGGVNKTFGLRTALILFVAARFFSWVYLAVANTQPVMRGYTLFWAVPLLFQNASDATLVYTMARTVCQPLVVAKGYKRARGIGLGFSIVYGLTGLAQVIAMDVIMGTLIDERYYWSQGFFSFIIPASGYGADAFLGLFGLLWGCVYLGLAVRALIQTRDTLSDDLRIVPKFMVAASVLWSTRAVLTAFTSYGSWDFAHGQENMYRITPFVSAILTDIGGLALFAILFHCYRPQQKSLYDGTAAPMIKLEDIKEPGEQA